MATLLNAPDLPSSDEDDIDFVPGEEPVGEHASGRKHSKAGKKRKLADTTAAASTNPALTSARVKQPSVKAAAAWDRLDRSRQAGISAVQSGASVSLASLCRPVTKQKTNDHAQDWMFQLGLASRKASSAITQPAQANGHTGSSEAQHALPESADPKSGPSEGAHADRGAQASAVSSHSAQQDGKLAKHDEPAHPNGSALPGPSEKPDQSARPGEGLAEPVDAAVKIPDAVKPTSRAAAAAARAKAALTAEAVDTEVRRFAGKDVQVKRTVDPQSEESRKQARQQGLDSVLKSLQAVKDVNTLEKSRSDWHTHKQLNPEEAAQLEEYKKSSNKYLDKVDFLERAGKREYEQDRDIRLAGDMRTRGRL